MALNPPPPKKNDLLSRFAVPTRGRGVDQKIILACGSIGLSCKQKSIKCAHEPRPVRNRVPFLYAGMWRCEQTPRDPCPLRLLEMCRTEKRPKARVGKSTEIVLRNVPSRKGLQEALFDEVFVHYSPTPRLTMRSLSIRRAPPYRPQTEPAYVTIEAMAALRFLVISFLPLAEHWRSAGS